MAGENTSLSCQEDNSAALAVSRKNPPADLTLPLGAQKNLEGSLSLQGLWVWVLSDQRQKKSQETFRSVDSGKWTPLPTQCLQICLSDPSIRFMHRGEAHREQPSLYLCEIPQAQRQAGEEEDGLSLQVSSPGEEHRGRMLVCLKWLPGEAPLQHPRGKNCAFIAPLWSHACNVRKPESFQGEDSFNMVCSVWKDFVPRQQLCNSELHMDLSPGRS